MKKINVKSENYVFFAHQRSTKPGDRVIKYPMIFPVFRQDSLFVTSLQPPSLYACR